MPAFASLGSQSFALGKRVDRFLGKLGGLLLLKLEQSTKGKKHINWYLHVSSQLPFVPLEWQTRLFLPECCSRLSLLKSVELLFRRARLQNNEVQNRWDWGETRKDFRGLRLLFFAAYKFASPVYLPHVLPQKFWEGRRRLLAVPVLQLTYPYLGFFLSGIIRCTCVACLWDWTTCFKYWAAAIYGSKKLWCAPIC